MTDKIKNPLDKLREPFPDHHISKLPKPTKAQTDAVKADFKKGIRCQLCGIWHHPNVIHVDYVGHAALTDRLLDTDPKWSWEPVAFRDGLPAFDQSGGLWIKLTVCDVTRLGYGHAASKPNIDPGAREKEVIGDALRNAAMRFGAALDLWHKGDLHIDESDDNAASKSSGADNNAPRQQQNSTLITPEHELMLVDKMREAGVGDEWLKARKYTKASDVPESKFQAAMKALNDIIASKNDLGDDVPY